MKQIDINCDMGESYGRFQIGNDREIFPYITSCNIACGFHGGDPLHIENTIRLALQHGTGIGAHPGYPDLAGFGRRKIHMTAEELRASLRYQVSALKGMVEGLGGQLRYVKPHGALYNAMAEEAEITHDVIVAIRDIDSDLKLMGLAGSLVQKIAREKNIPFIAEAFADRRYEPNGMLRSRTLDGAVLSDPQQAANQVISIVLKHQAHSIQGLPVAIEAQSICVHGDNPQVVPILESISSALEEHGIERKSIA